MEDILRGIASWNMAYGLRIRTRISIRVGEARRTLKDYPQLASFNYVVNAERWNRDTRDNVRY
jgi:hypothetical protein